MRIKRDKNNLIKKREGRGECEKRVSRGRVEGGEGRRMEERKRGYSAIANDDLSYGTHVTHFVGQAVHQLVVRLVSNKQ